MARKKSRSFTDVEMEFMRIIWEIGGATPDDIRAALADNNREISVGSIRNVLAIMMEKGYIRRRKQGKAYVYSAKVPKNETRMSLIGDLLDSVFDGSESLVVAALLENRTVSDEERGKIRRIIDEYGRDEKR